MSQIIRSFASSVVFACPAQEQRIAPVLFETLLPIAGHCDPSRGRIASGVGVGVGVATGVGAGVGSSGLNTGFRFGFGAALTVTPLFQTSFVPDLMQVNFLPPAVAVDPALVHLAPALTDAKDGAEIMDSDSSSATRTLLRVITKRYQGTRRN